MAAAEELYTVPALKDGEAHTSEIIVKKSRFITSIGHTAGLEQCRAFIAAVSAQHPQANHNCFAFNGAAPNSTAVCGCSDDGEPHGTAGQPMLNVIAHCGIGEITAVVTRYFGGTLLGTGGLVKAYQDAVKTGLSELPTAQRLIPAYIEAVLEHSQVGWLMHLLPDFGAEIMSQDFGVQVKFKLRLPKSKAETLAALIADKTRGRGQIKVSFKP